MARLLAFVLVALAFSLPASAATYLDPGQIGLFGDPAAEERFATYRHLEPFDVYVVIQEPAQGIRAWEASIEIPPEFILMGIELDHPNSVNVGQTIGNTVNMIVGLGGGCSFSPEPYPLATLTLMSIERISWPVDICMGAATPSSFDPPIPGYVTCLEELAPLDLASPSGVEGCGQLGADWCGPIWPARTFLGMLSANGAPGEFADMPLLGASGGYLDCWNEARDLTRIDLELEWDFAVGTLESVTLDGLPPDWGAAITPQTTGALVSLTGTTGIQLLYGVSTHLASMRFQLTMDPGSTVVDILSVAVDGPSIEDLPALVGGPDIQGPAILSSEPVTTEAESFGSLKATFRE
jgi:hypothetical protein